MLYSDGGARGNPGLSAIAFLAVSEEGKLLASHSRYIGVHTNNQAEYAALLWALEYASSTKVPHVVCHLDSELVVKQLNGQYRIKNPQLFQLYSKVQTQKRCFSSITFVNVPRENDFIQKADKLVNQSLDNQLEEFRRGATKL